MIIVKVDTREQSPWLFRQARLRRAALSEGDYALAGDPLGLVIERKSVEDLFGTVTKGEARFERELKRLGQYAYPVVIVEGSPRDVIDGARFSEASGMSVLGHILRLGIRHRVPIMFGGSRMDAQDLAWQLLKARYEERHAPVRLP